VTKRAIGVTCDACFRQSRPGSLIVTYKHMLKHETRM